MKACKDENREIGIVERKQMKFRENERKK